MAKINNEAYSESESELEKRKARNLVSPDQRIEEQKALQRAKELEKKHVPTAKDEFDEIKELVNESESAKKLLKSSWYIKKNKKNK